MSMLDSPSRTLVEAVLARRRVGFAQDRIESEIEIRQVFEASDFGDEFTPELREAEERMREQIAQKK